MKTDVRMPLIQPKVKNPAISLAGLLSVFLTLVAQSGAHALGIGEVVLHSKLGEPLFAQVELQVNGGETVEDACLSVTPDEASGSAIAGITARLGAGGRRIEIRSRNAFNEPFAVLRLQVKCPGMGSVARTLTLLPELAAAPAADPPPHASPLPPPAQPVEVAAPMPERPLAPFAATPQATAPVAASVTPSPAVRPSSPLPQAQRPRRERPPVSRPAAARKMEGGFVLRLTGDPLDMSRLGKLSDQDRELLLAQRRLLDEDDLTAHMLAMQHQIKQMKEEMDAIHLKLSALENRSPAPVEAPGPIASAAAPEQAGGMLPLRHGLMLFGVLAGIVFTWWMLRRIARTPSPVLPPQETPLPELPAHAAPKIATPGAAGSPVPAVMTGAAQPSHSAEPPVAQPEPEAEQAAPVSEEEVAVLEEAELYAAYGRPEKGAAILQEFVAQHPASVQAWMLLLSIYSARGQIAEFENAARAFLRHHESHPQWKTMQALGRTLDRANPLYLDENELASSAPPLPYFARHKHRPVGDILVELGYLSLQDMQNCLNDFDSKQHGRFGNYLVMRRQITHAQLNEALLRQQEEEAQPLVGDAMPTLQQVEDMLKGFDPQRDGSVEAYLMTHRDDVAEQLAHAVETVPAAAETGQPAPVTEAERPMDFALNFDLGAPDQEKSLQPTEDGQAPPPMLDIELTLEPPVIRPPRE